MALIIPGAQMQLLLLQMLPPSLLFCWISPLDFNLLIYIVILLSSVQNLWSHNRKVLLDITSGLQSGAVTES